MARYKRRIALLFASSVSLCGGSCGPPSDPPLAPVSRLSPSTHPAVGCWQFAQRLWSDLPADSLVVQLDSVADDSVLLRLTVAPADSALRRRTRFSHWGIYDSEPDSVYVVLGDGLTGTVLRLRVVGDEMNGHAYPFVDFPAPRHSRSVTAVRVACEAAA
jgi:hypothetical protein